MILKYEKFSHIRKYSNKPQVQFNTGTLIIDYSINNDNGDSSTPQIINQLLINIIEKFNNILLINEQDPAYSLFYEIDTNNHIKCVAIGEDDNLINTLKRVINLNVGNITVNYIQTI